VSNLRTAEAYIENLLNCGAGKGPKEEHLQTGVAAAGPRLLLAKFAT